MYPGTFDPITCGHVDLIQRILHLFDDVLVAVASNPSKQPLFPLEKRIALIQDIFAKQTNIQVQGFSGLMVDFAQINHVSTVIRGLRTTGDFDFEMPLANVNRHLNPQLETLFLAPSPHLSFISSTFVRDIAKHGGSTTGLVPENVEQALKTHFSSME